MKIHIDPQRDKRLIRAAILALALGDYYNWDWMTSIAVILIAVDFISGWEPPAIEGWKGPERE